MKRIFFTALCILAALTGRADMLSQQFQQPTEQRIAVYWYWMSDNISVEGVQHDLEAMKKAGITRAFIGNIWQDEVKPGTVKALTPEWWEVMHAALKKATELDIEIGVFNSPGWSQSGGPWVKPTQAMRYLKGEPVRVQGNEKTQVIKLPSLGEDATNVRVLALPLYSTHHIKDVMLDKKAGEDFTADVHFETPIYVRSVTFTTEQYLLADVLIQARTEGSTYKTLKTVHLDRTNTNPNVGFHPYAPISISVPTTYTQDVRLICKGGPQDCHFKASVSSVPRVERYEEKSLAKMFQSPLPMWGEYMWPTEQEPEKFPILQPSQVLDLTGKMQPDGTLTWDVPHGPWEIIRTGMVPTGVTNSPASKEATGLEVDKMSREHVAAHFDAFLGELLRRIPEEDRRSFKVVVEDSYETGGQNWTDDFIESFKETYGYDPVSFIPVMYGHIVGSQDQSERFLWDLRRLVADRVAYDYVGGLRDKSHEHGLTTWLECYGHWGFPSEFLMYGGQSDEVGGEFWSEGSLGDIENRAASSCAHIYGKEKVWAESCTAGGPNFNRYPAVMKQRTDRFFCEGINATLLHLFIQQPDDTTLPGISAPFGNDFQRKNTWFSQMDLFTDYLRRCNFMLQQGRYVADVAYFIGEDAPKMTGEQNPALPRGYSFDYVNAEVLKKAWVSDGMLRLESGMSYRVLVLPDQVTMRPEMVETLAWLVDLGLTVVGPRPQRSPSMQNYPYGDRRVQRLTDMIWTDGYGKGKIYPEGTDLQKVFDEMGVKPDCYVDPAVPFAFIHRTILGGREMYFVSNQSDQPRQFDARFRVTGLKPQIWSPTTAERHSIEQYTDDGTQTTIPLSLAPNESAFILFDQVWYEPVTPAIQSDPQVLVEFDTPWQVEFDEKMRGPKGKLTWEQLTPWNESADEAVRYYSGTAVYTNSVKFKKVPEGEVYLDLGKVMVMAKVYVNDVYAGGAWTAPYRVPVTGLLRKGVNKIRIEVVNNWWNRLVGDQQLPESERPTWTSVNHCHADSPLQESGLIGPVRLLQ